MEDERGTERCQGKVALMPVGWPKDRVPERNMRLHGREREFRDEVVAATHQQAVADRFP
jgi:hypothetical protein